MYAKKFSSYFLYCHKKIEIIYFNDFFSEIINKSYKIKKYNSYNPANKTVRDETFLIVNYSLLSLQPHMPGIEGS